MRDENLDRILPDIKAVARSVAFKWPTITTAEDLVNDLALHFLEREGSLEKLAGMEVGERRASLTRVGHQICAAMRADFEVFSGQYRYSVDEVKQALSKGALKGQDSYNVQASDIIPALQELDKKNPEQAQVLARRYLQGVKIERGAEESLLRRAEDNLALLMNKSNVTEDYEYDNGGRYRNNRQAINQVDLDYDGEGRFDE